MFETIQAVNDLVREHGLLKALVIGGGVVGAWSLVRCIKLRDTLTVRNIDALKSMTKALNALTSKNKCDGKD